MVYSFTKTLRQVTQCDGLGTLAVHPGVLHQYRQQHQPGQSAGAITAIDCTYPRDIQPLNAIQSWFAVLICKFQALPRNRPSGFSDPASTTHSRADPTLATHSVVLSVKMDDQFIIHLLFHPEYIPYEVRPLIPGTHHLPITNPDRLLEFASEDHKMTAATAPPGVKVSIMNPDRLLEFPRKDHKMTDATVPDVDEPIPEPFRLLDLPREVRDEIYHAMLCDWPKGPVSQHILVLGMLQVTPLFRRITPRILLANKQTYQEAKLVLLKGNQFIHVNLVVNDSSIIPSIFIPSTMPVVASGRNRVALFRHLVVMKYDINWPRAPRLEYQHGQIEAIMLYRDLEQLCKSIDRVDQSTRRFSIQPQQRITMYNPFKLTMSPLFLNRKIQVRIHIVWAGS